MAIARDRIRPTVVSQAAPARRPEAARPAAMRQAGPPALRLRPPVAAPSRDGMSEAVYQLVRSPGPGVPLRPEVREPLEDRLGVDLEPVRVHNDVPATLVADAMPALAFTHGTDVFLGSRSQPTDLGLMAHEVAHVLQQQAAPAVQSAGGPASGGALEAEARHVADTVVQGGAADVAGRTGGPGVQREEGGGLIESAVRRLIHEFAPDLEPILRVGVFEWLKEKISGALESVVNGVLAPVRAVTGFAQSISAHFSKLVDWMRDAAAKVARGDCKPISEAADKIQQVVEGLAAPVIDKIKEVAGKAKAVFDDLWAKFGAPAWDYVKGLLGSAWDGVKRIGQKIWDWTKPVRDLAASAWTWLKNKLGIGEGPEGQNGLLQWFERKASDSWEWIKAKIEPIKKPLMVVAGVLVLLSPAGPMLVLGAAVYGLITGVRWIKDNLTKAGGIVAVREYVRATILPPIMRAVGSVTGAFQKGAKFITDKLDSVMGGLSSLLGAVGGSILSFAKGAVQWIVDQFQALVSWGTDKLMGLVDLVKEGLEKLHQFLQPLLDFLGKVGEVVADILKLPFLLIGRLWNKIPECIRKPFVDFFVKQILGRIPLFRDIVAAIDLWSKVKPRVMAIVQMVFKDHDLVGAMKATFRLILDVLKVPVKLAMDVWAKAQAAWDVVSAKPIEFLKNILRAMLAGFQRFYKNIVSHLTYGLFAWLTNSLSEQGVQPPTSLSDYRGILRVVLAIFGITVNHVFELIEKRTSPETARKLRSAFDKVVAGFEWLVDVVREGPSGLWRKIKEQVSNLGDMLLDAVMSWITENVTTQALIKLLTSLDPTGIMAVVNSLIGLYAAIQTAVEYMQKILEMVNRVLDSVIDIAKGNLEPAAILLEGAMRRALPVIIGFLANFVGKTKIGQKIKEMIVKAREAVDKGIIWLIDGAVKIGKGVLNLFKGKGREARFTVGAESHRVFESGEGEAVQLKIASSPNPAREQLDLFQSRLDEVPSNKEAGQALNNRDLARKLIQDARVLVDSYTPKKSDAELGTTFGKIIPLVKSLFSIFGHPAVPASRVIKNSAIPRSSPPYPNEFGEKGDEVVIAPLTRKAPPGLRGSESARVPIAGWNVAEAANSQAGEIWVRGHLLSFRLHGPGNVAWNLAPITKDANAAMRQVEDAANSALESSHGEAQLTYRAKMNYRPGNGPESDFPASIYVGCWNYDASGNGFQGAVIGLKPSIPVPPPVIGNATVNLNTANSTDLRYVGKFSPELAEAIVRARTGYSREYGRLDGMDSVVFALAHFTAISPEAAHRLVVELGSKFQASTHKF